MIRASIDRRTDGGKIVICGHAPRPPGAEKTGNLVCAAASFLAQITAASLEKVAGVAVTGYEERSGYASFSWTGRSTKAEAVLDEWELGMSWLADSYDGTLVLDKEPSDSVQ